MEPSGDAVKAPKGTPARSPKPTGFARRFEGWEVGGIVVTLVLSAALLAVPRAADPTVFPLPLVDVAEESATRVRYDSLADRAEREGLPFETRAVGDAIRRLGSALAGQRGDAEHEVRVLTERVAAALQDGQDDALARLRAVQARLFVRAVRQHAFSGPVSPELAALGGDFAKRAVQSGWAGKGGCLASDDELRTLFALRWLELTRLREDPRFRPGLGELRRYYRFLLLYPEGDGAADPARARALSRLRYAEALSRRDSEYPVALVRGTVFGGVGSNTESAAELTAHLSRSSGAVWTLRARNYLLAVTPESFDEP